MLFVSIVYLSGLHCFVLYSASCTAQSKTAKVITDMEQEGAAQSPSGAPIAVEMSQVEGFFKSTIDFLTSKLTNKIDEKLQSFKRQIVEEQSSRLDSAVKRFKKDGYFFKKEGNRQMYEHEEKVMGVLVEASMGDPLLKNTSRMTLHQIQKTKRDSRGLRDTLKGRSKPCWLDVPDRRTRDFSRCQSVERKFKVHHLMTTLGLVDF